MVEFIRGILQGMFKSIAYLAFSALIAAFIAGTFASKDNLWTVFFCSWAITGTVMFTFPNLINKEL